MLVLGWRIVAVRQRKGTQGIPGKMSSPTRFAGMNQGKGRCFRQTSDLTEGCKQSWPWFWWPGHFEYTYCHPRVLDRYAQKLDDGVQSLVFNEAVDDGWGLMSVSDYPEPLRERRRRSFTGAEAVVAHQANGFVASFSKNFENCCLSYCHHLLLVQTQGRR